MIIVVAGTRPEIIKLAPVVFALKELGSEHQFWTIRQHSTLIDRALADFSMLPDVDISLDRVDGSLPELVSEICLKLSNHISSLSHHTTFVVQGDTTTSFTAGFLAKMYKYKVVHVEAGLRSFDEQNPFPEEINRKLIAQLADVHFAPTTAAVDNLLSCGVSAERIHLVGNTVIDALLYQIRKMGLENKNNLKRQILVTSHRRENWENGISEISLGIKHVIDKYPEIQVKVLSHPNQVLLQKWKEEFCGVEQVKILHSISYAETVEAIFQSEIVLTDSGGIQEEATTLKKATGVLRKTTERPEILYFPENSLIGTDPVKIFNFCDKIFSDTIVKSIEEFKPRNVFGDGNAGLKIAECLVNTE